MKDLMNTNNNNILPINIEEQWRKTENDFGLSSDNIIFQSKDPGRRIYKNGNQVIKIICYGVENSSTRRRNNLMQEYSMLELVKNIEGVVRLYSFKKKSSGECIYMEPIKGKILSDISIFKFSWWIVYFKLVPILYRLTLLRIAHNDIKPSNIIVTSNLKPVIIDFDQATSEPLYKVFYYNFLICHSSKGIRSGMLGLIRRALKDRLK